MSLKKHKQYLFIIPLVLFIIDYLLIESKLIKPIDYSIYCLSQYLYCDIMTEFFKFCSFMGSTTFYVVSVIFMMIWKGKRNILTGIHLLIIQAINRIIKYLVKRPRPDKIFHLVKETNYSFPSGHAMSAMAGYGLFMMTLNQSDFKYKKQAMIFCGIMIFLIGFSRIYLGVHYFSDVIGGYLLALSYILFVYYNTKMYV